MNGLFYKQTNPSHHIHIFVVKMVMAQRSDFKTPLQKLNDEVIFFLFFCPWPKYENQII